VYTARRMSTHNGNAAPQRWWTSERSRLPHWEKVWCFPAMKLNLAKPAADFYIDDLAVSSNYDVERSLGLYTTDVKLRAFNSVTTSSPPMHRISDHSQSKHRCIAGPRDLLLQSYSPLCEGLLSDHDCVGRSGAYQRYNGIASLSFGRVNNAFLSSHFGNVGSYAPRHPILAG
jgi:hypothetical protein